MSIINKIEIHTFVWTENQVDIAFITLSSNFHFEQLCRRWVFHFQSPYLISHRKLAPVLFVHLCM